MNEQQNSQADAGRRSLQPDCSVCCPEAVPHPNGKGTAHCDLPLNHPGDHESENPRHKWKRRWSPRHQNQ